MSARARELELLLLTMFAAVPLYGTQTVSLPPLITFHLLMLAMALRVWFGRSPEIVPAAIMRGIAILYVIFYIVDAAVISRNAIAASTHLVFFIAAYQPLEAGRTRNTGQRLLTTALLFVASLATATHISIVPFVIVFAFLMFRQLIQLSHQESSQMAGTPAAEFPRNRAALFYLAGTTLLGVLLFPLMPRVRNPIVPGMGRGMEKSSTGLSDSIDFNNERSISPDSTVVSRVWMSQETIPFFTPLRLRGTIYDRFYGNQWLQTQGGRGGYPLPSRNGVTRIARPSGMTRIATVQQRLVLGRRLLLPLGTFAVTGIGRMSEGMIRDTYVLDDTRREIVSYDVLLARDVAPLRVRRVSPTNYPVTPPVAQMAHRIVGTQTEALKQAAAVERYLSTEFRYIPDPSQIGHAMTVDDFLLREKRGHCEYFAAGMVALLTALDVPSRIVGGFYGGKLNPLTGYLVVRKEDAHAWVEVFDGNAWRTFDPTPASLRPGNAQAGLLRVYAAALGDSINYFWDRYILTFGLADQIALIVDFLGRARNFAEAMRGSGIGSFASLLTPRFAAVLLALIAGGAVLVWIARRRRPVFELLAAHLRRLGIEVGAAMTMEEALQKLRRVHPDEASSLEPLIELYEAERFSSHPEPSRVRDIRRRLAELRA